MLPLNLYENRAGMAELARSLDGILTDIESARKSGHLRRDLSTPTDVKYQVTEALRECVRRSIVPPTELVELVARLFGTVDEKRRRAAVKFPEGKARAIKRATGLSGRKLAGAMRKAGLDVKDRSVARFDKRQRMRTVPQKG